ESVLEPRDRHIGRPPAMLTINRDVGRILAIDIEPDCLRVVLTDPLVEPVIYREHLIDRFSQPDVVMRQIESLCQEVLREVEADSLLGVGLSLPGLIDEDEGVLISSTNMPKWHKVPVAQLVERKIGLRPKVGRSTQLAARYEAWMRPQSQANTCVLISVRTGIGMSIILNGEMHPDLGGELGHT